MKTAPTILWFRNDLRLADNAALSAAIELGFPIVPVFIWDPSSYGAWTPGAASKWWLHHALDSLNTSLCKYIKHFKIVFFVKNQCLNWWLLLSLGLVSIKNLSKQMIQAFCQYFIILIQRQLFPQS